VKRRVKTYAKWLLRGKGRLLKKRSEYSASRPPP